MPTFLFWTVSTIVDCLLWCMLARWQTNQSSPWWFLFFQNLSSCCQWSSASNNPLSSDIFEWWKDISIMCLQWFKRYCPFMWWRRASSSRGHHFIEKWYELNSIQWFCKWIVCKTPWILLKWFLPYNHSVAQEHYFEKNTWCSCRR